MLVSLTFTGRGQTTTEKVEETGLVLALTPWSPAYAREKRRKPVSQKANSENCAAYYAENIRKGLAFRSVLADC